jgi:hypothetical protein
MKYRTYLKLHDFLHKQLDEIHLDYLKAVHMVDNTTLTEEEKSLTNHELWQFRLKKEMENKKELEMLRNCVRSYAKLFETPELQEFWGEPEKVD